jgi:ribosomal protein S18 acetylase RimI-like enzyme
MVDGEERDVLELVMRAFDADVRPDFSQRGVEEFVRSARSFVLDPPAGHEILVAEVDGELAGMLDLRDCSHVSLFFVDAAYRGRGVGRALVDRAVGRGCACDSAVRALTANSSPGAVGAYEALGFARTGDERTVDGIRSVPMELRV